MQTDLTGRALDEAAARAMGAEIADDAGAFRLPKGMWRGFKSDPLTIDEMLAWLHGRGIVKTASSAIACDVAFIPRLGTQSFDSMVTYPQAHGTDLREAMARLVVAVAAREATDGK